MDPQNPQQPDQVHFNVPQIQPQLMQQPPPEQPTQQETDYDPEKKWGWKLWVIIILAILIAASLGFYFLRF